MSMTLNFKKSTYRLDFRRTVVNTACFIGVVEEFLKLNAECDRTTQGAFFLTLPPLRGLKYDSSQQCIIHQTILI